MTIKEATKSIEIYKRIQELTGVDHSEEIKACENDIEEIKQERKTRKMLRDMKSKKDSTAWGELIKKLN